MQAILAPGSKLEIDLLHSSASKIPDAVHIAATICQNDIRTNLLNQFAALEERVEQEKEKKDKKLATMRQWAYASVTAEVIIGLSLAACLVVVLARGSTGGSAPLVIGLLAIIIIAAVCVWTWQRGASRREGTAASFEESIARLNQLKDQVEPGAILRFGKIWWVLQLIHLPDNEVIPLVLTRNPIPLVIEPDQQGRPHPGEDSNRASSETELIRLVERLEQLKTEAESWAIVNTAWSPIIAQDHAQEKELKFEISSLLHSQPVQSIEADLPILYSNDPVVLLKDSATEYATAWEACRQNAIGWNARFKGIRTRAQQVCVQAQEVFFQNCKDLPTTDGQTPKPFADWLNLAEQRPDVEELVSNIKAEQEQLAIDLAGGIDRAELELLLDNLKEAMFGAHELPWKNSADPVDELKRQYGNVESRLKSIDEKLQELSRDIRQIRDGYSVLGSRQLDQQIRQIEQTSRQIEQKVEEWRRTIEKLANQVTKRINAGEGMAKQEEHTNRPTQLPTQIRQPTTLTSPNRSPQVDLGLGLLRQQLRTELDSLHNLKEQLGESNSQIQTGIRELNQNLAGSISNLEAVSVAVQALDKSSGKLSRDIEHYESFVSQYVGEVKRLLGQTDRTITDVDRDLERRRDAIDDYQRKIRGHEEDYNMQLEKIKRDAQARKEKLKIEDKQQTLEWLSWEPEILIKELTGVEKSQLVDLYDFPASTTIQQAISSQVQQAVNQGYQHILQLCNAREEAIDKTYESAKQAIRVGSKEARKVEFLLVPIWYIEWSETENPEQPDQKQINYRFLTPLQMKPFPDGTIQTKPLYPAIERYITSASLPINSPLGKRSFLPTETPSEPLAARARQFAYLKDAEVKALVTEAKEATKAGVYDQLLHDVVAKSRANLLQGKLKYNSQDRHDGPTGAASAR